MTFSLPASPAPLEETLRTVAIPDLASEHVLDEIDTQRGHDDEEVLEMSVLVEIAQILRDHLHQSLNHASHDETASRITHVNVIVRLQETRH